MVPVLAIAVLSYSVVPGFPRIAYVGPAIKYIKKHAGILVLFKKEKGLSELPVIYSYYANGAWHEYGEIQVELFDRYCKTGNYGTLKHCWMDGALKSDVYYRAYDTDVAKIKESKNYRILKTHMVTFHSNNTMPDSVKFSFYTPKVVNVKERELVLTFKDTL